MAISFKNLEDSWSALKLCKDSSLPGGPVLKNNILLYSILYYTASVSATKTALAHFAFPVRPKIFGNYAFAASTGPSSGKL